MVAADPNWIVGTEFTAAAVTVAAVLLAFVVGGVHRLWRLSKRMVEFFDDYGGTAARPGVPARPGVMERLALQDRQIALVVSEVTPNGGGSLKDQVQLAAASAAAAALTAAAVERRLVVVESKADAAASSAAAAATAVIDRLSP